MLLVSVQTPSTLGFDDSVETGAGKLVLVFGARTSTLVPLLPTLSRVVRRAVLPSAAKTNSETPVSINSGEWDE
jgi:hypothetical protein